MIREGLLYQQTLHLTLPVPALEALPTCLESLSLGLFACLISAWSTSPNFCLPRPLRSQFNLHNLREESLICLAITAHCTAVSTTVTSQVYLLRELQDEIILLVYLLVFFLCPYKNIHSYTYIYEEYMFSSPWQKDLSVPGNKNYHD